MMSLLSVVQIPRNCSYLTQIICISQFIAGFYTMIYHDYPWLSMINQWLIAMNNPSPSRHTAGPILRRWHDWPARGVLPGGSKVAHGSPKDQHPKNLSETLNDKVMFHEVSYFGTCICFWIWGKPDIRNKFCGTQKRARTALILGSGYPFLLVFN